MGTGMNSIIIDDRPFTNRPIPKLLIVVSRPSAVMPV